ncbi:MAG: metallophosphoesterase [Bacteroidota bacterium]
MKWTRRKFIKTGIFLTISALLADAFWFEKAFIEINEFPLKGSDKGKLGLKFIQISDLHIKSVNWQLKALAKKVNALKPDLIFITGDAVEDADHLTVLDQFLSLLDHNLKKVAITGNWEYWGGVNLSVLNSLYQKHNCDLLINQAKQYQFRGYSVLVTGTDDFVGGSADISKALQEFKPSDCHIVLNHCPQYAEIIASQLTVQTKANAILAGHTHGGQVNLFGFVPFVPPGSGDYLKGWYTIGATDMYVSKGIGTSLLPVRFGARAEVAVFTI